MSKNFDSDEELELSYEENDDQINSEDNCSQII